MPLGFVIRGYLVAGQVLLRRAAVITSAVAVRRMYTGRYPRAAASTTKNPPDGYCACDNSRPTGVAPDQLPCFCSQSSLTYTNGILFLYTIIRNTRI
jgi:hypothetical protein